MMIEIALLGRFSVRRGGEEVPPGAFGGRLARTLVRVLVTRRGAFVSRDFLTEALWPERAPADPAANLNVMINRARRALGIPSLILTGPGGYVFAVDDRCKVDAEAFLAGVEAGRRTLAASHPAAALREFQAVLGLWAGEPLAEDAYADWAYEFRSRLARAHLEALEQAAAAALEIGDPGQAVALAELAVVREPLREPSHLLLVGALAASGDTAGALAAFDSFRRRFAEELGLNPSSEALELQTRILRGELPAPPHRRPGPATSAPILAARPAFEELPFVGREEELKAILAGAEASEPGIVLVSGRAGTGKSRLLAELEARSALPVLSARAFLPEREDPWGLARSLLRAALGVDVAAARAIPERAAQALADIVPELEEVRSIGRASVDPESRRALALEGAVRLIGALSSAGTLVLADDLQWADATSLVFMGLLSRRMARLGLVLAYRPEDVSPDSAAARFLAELPNLPAGPLSVSLGPLSREAISRLVSDEALAEAIAQATDRTPFVVSEVMRALVGQGAVEREPDGRWRPRTVTASEIAGEAARAGQRRAIEVRVESQPSGRRELLFMLALLGREAPARLLAISSGIELKKVLGELDALARAGLVRLGEAGWATAHDLIGETITEVLERAERGRLHEMIAEGLRAVGADASELARHLAGAGDREAAAGALGEAARQRQDRHASGEAELLAEAGLALDPPAPLRSRLLEVRAEARARRGDLASAREDLRGALAGQERAADRSRLLARMAMLASGSEDLARAAELAELAISQAGGQPDARAEALFVGAIVDMNADRRARAQARFAEALALFEQLGNARGVADIMDGRAMAALLGGMLREAAEAFDHVARLFMELGNLLRVVTPRASRGLALVWMGRPAEALHDTDEALELARTLGHPEGEAYALWCWSEALTALGRIPEALETAEEALAIAERLGHGEWTATSLRGLGIARQAAGDPEGAEAAFRRSLEVAKHRHLPHFESFAAARLASALVSRGDLGEAGPMVDRALATGLPLSLYEARLAQAQLAAARGDPDSAAVIAGALELAEAGEHLQSALALRRLLTSVP